MHKDWYGWKRCGWIVRIAGQTQQQLQKPKHVHIQTKAFKWKLTLPPYSLKIQRIILFSIRTGHISTRKSINSFFFFFQILRIKLEEKQKSFIVHAFD